ncbi:glycosyl transferase family 1 [Mycobacterium alsense]|uniref:glycosyltransferase n=1 Tax=Mycobacterium alsense TaxID=324058 RepID=UPI0007FD5468|nr:glycosyltransferase [Mycobacterium alsense]OBJ04799.1 glycosyl transferase family 1 [Mycobacterium alsense]
MKFVLANWGTRGEVEPYVTVGRELVRRGHEVHMAVAPEMVSFTEAAGPKAVAYGPALKAILDPHRDFWAGLFTTPWRIRELGRLLGEYSEPLTQCREEVCATLASLADGADLLLTGMNYEDDAVNVAEHYDIPLATLHIFPLRINGQLVSFLPAPFARSAMTALDWLAWRGGKKVEDAQRRGLGLPSATRPWPRRITERGSLEIQAYDEVCYPGLAAEWATWNGHRPPRRPFVGALTMELPTDADEEVASWIAAGKPPICFGFGSVGVESAADTLAMISSACAQLGERALICAAGSDYSNVTHSDDVKVVSVMNYAAALPGCRAFVHHGGAGTTNAGLRAGLPTLILWTLPDQGLWSARVKRLKVGTGRRFSATTEKSLVADLRTVLDAQCLTRARELAAQMTKASDSVATAADLVEDFARREGVG